MHPCMHACIHTSASVFQKDNETVKPDSELSFAESFGRKTTGVVQGEFNVHFIHVTFQCPYSGRLPRGGHPLGRQSYVEDVSTMQCQLSDVSSCHVFSLQLQLAGGKRAMDETGNDENFRGSRHKWRKQVHGSSVRGTVHVDVTDDDVHVTENADCSLGGALAALNSALFQRRRVVLVIALALDSETFLNNQPCQTCIIDCTFTGH